MCASGAQNQVQAQDIATMQEYDKMMQQQYANQQQLYQAVNSVLQPILKAGPSQEGMSEAEKANLNATAVEGTAVHYAGAARAINENLAAEGGGNVPVSSGAAESLRASVAQSAAENESQQETAIKEKSYELGRENFLNAEQGELAIAAGENPLGYMANLTNQNKVTGDEANAIAAQNNSWENALIGAAGAIGSAALKG